MRKHLNLYLSLAVIVSASVVAVSSVVMAASVTYLAHYTQEQFGGEYDFTVDGYQETYDGAFDDQGVGDKRSTSQQQLERRNRGRTGLGY